MTLWIPRAFHELDVSTRSKDQLNRWTPVTEGPAKTSRRLPALDTFAAPEKDHRPRSWSVPFSFAGHCASLPPCGVPRSRCQSASSSLLQPTFHVTSTRRNIPFGDCPPSAVGNPPTFDIETALPALGLRLRPWCGAGPPCGHPASNGCALDGAFAGFRSFDSHLPTCDCRTFRARHAEGEAPRRYRPKVPLSKRTL